LKERSRDSIDQFLDDDVAVLGIADGIAQLQCRQIQEVSQIKTWLSGLLSNHFSRSLWSKRMSDLAGDLIDGRGRLRENIEEDDPAKLALELALSASWASAFRLSTYPNEQLRKILLKKLLTDPVPSQGDIDRVFVWFKALDVLIDQSVEAITPTTSDIVRLLRRTQHSFKRWVYETSTRRGQINPVRWIIDNEAHVQSFLWSVLYPVFGQDVADEKYLQDYGQVQPRFDLGLIKLKLIIEVKIIRERGDFADIEEQIAGDLGLYFRDPTKFDSMVVYIYDDCDIHYPESYDALRNALMQRERIEDVVFVRRPSMLPNRDQRKV